MLEVEYQAPNTSACECCGGTTTRFVSREGDAHAVYFARFSDSHPDGSASAGGEASRRSESRSPWISVS